ncbi:UDP-N-acetylmuramoyl-tripeptide--D-alanyl-D-alanine ligase [Luteimonas pelagia]
MTPVALTRIAEAVGGRLVGADTAHDVLIDAVSTDTRALDHANGQGVLFVALRGERFDGHDHAAAAEEGGARALLVSRPLDVRLPQVVVADTERALAALASAMHRARNGRTRVLAVTGSNGKTTVKTLLLSILSRCGKAYGNPGNRNNEIGLPLAVIDAPDDADFAVYEMGAGKPGDIAYLTAVARPEVSLVNNIAPAHLERMGSLLGVADTKAAIYDALPNGGTAVINADDAFAPYFAERAHGRRIVRFGIESTADVVARDIQPEGEGTRFTMDTPQGAIDATLALPGRHNVRNALAAAAMAMAVGATLEQVRDGLAAATPVAGRLVVRTLPGGATLVDDSYNANPGSLLAAIELLGAGPQAGWLVLGDMRELGDDAAALHAEAGRRARAAGIKRLYALGELSAHAARAFGEDGRVFSAHAALADALRADLGTHPDVRVLVKGSRGSRMDRIVEALLPGGPGEAHDAA